LEEEKTPRWRVLGRAGQQWDKKKEVVEAVVAGDFTETLLEMGMGWFLANCILEADGISVTSWRL